MTALLERELREFLNESGRAYQEVFAHRRQAIIKARAEELVHTLDEGESEALRALLDTTRTQNQLVITVNQTLHWLAMSSLPVQVYDSSAIETSIASALEVPTLIERAHKLLGAFDHFLKEENNHE
jgi:hypothetical protein